MPSSPLRTDHAGSEESSCSTRAAIVGATVPQMVSCTSLAAAAPWVAASRPPLRLGTNLALDALQLLPPDRYPLPSLLQFGAQGGKPLAMLLLVVKERRVCLALQLQRAVELRLGPCQTNGRGDRVLGLAPGPLCSITCLRGRPHSGVLGREALGLELADDRHLVLPSPMQLRWGGRSCVVALGVFPRHGFLLALRVTRRAAARVSAFVTRSITFGGGEPVLTPPLAANLLETVLVSGIATGLRARAARGLGGCWATAASRCVATRRRCRLGARGGGKVPSTTGRCGRPGREAGTRNSVGWGAGCWFGSRAATSRCDSASRAAQQWPRSASADWPHWAPAAIAAAGRAAAAATETAAVAVAGSRAAGGARAAALKTGGAAGKVRREPAAPALPVPWLRSARPAIAAAAATASPGSRSASRTPRSFRPRRRCAATIAAMAARRLTPDPSASSALPATLEAFEKVTQSPKNVIAAALPSSAAALRHSGAGRPATAVVRR